MVAALIMAAAIRPRPNFVKEGRNRSTADRDRQD